MSAKTVEDNNAAAPKTESEAVRLRAENSPDGIALFLDFIPENTIRVFVQIMEKLEEGKNPVPVFADIRGDALAALKETGSLICPFAESGRSYVIAVSLEDGTGMESATWLSAETAADKGVYITNEATLNLNDAKTGVSLSAEPVFSAPLEYGDLKYRYMVTILVDGMGSIGYGDRVESSLSWNFMPGMIEDLERDQLELTGELSAYVTAFCNVDYENVQWAVGVANTEEFTLSL